MSLIPYVIEQTSKGERSYDIYSRLLKDRIVILGEEVNETTASIITAELPGEGYPSVHQQPRRKCFGRTHDL